MPRAVRRFLRDESAIAVAEYGLLLACVVLLVVAAIHLFGSSIRSWFDAKMAGLTNATAAPRDTLAPLPP